jgi:hypothetical protein
MIKSILISLLILVCLDSLSQEIPVRVAFGNEATAIPYTKFFSTPFHPVAQIGTEFAYKENTHNYLYQTANLGYIYHKYLYQGIYLSTELGYDYRFDFGLNLKAMFGLGYLQTFAVSDEYQFKDGEYVLGKDWGNARLMPSLSIGAGYRIKPADTHSPEIFVLYQSWVEYPYSPGFIPLMTHIDLMVGMKFFINTSKSERYED